jgi:hypothetical protein
MILKGITNPYNKYTSIYGKVPCGESIYLYPKDGEFYQIIFIGRKSRYQKTEEIIKLLL